jgi:SRSO17 transposase
MNSEIIWRKAKNEMEFSDEGFLVFDDTVLNKEHSKKIEGVLKQYSGNEGRIIKGIGLVTCVYIEPGTNQFWVIDCRIFNPEEDGKSKLDHVKDMLDDAIQKKELPFKYVLMDTWYATQKMMSWIDDQGKIFYCPIKKNRQIKLEGAENFISVNDYEWSQGALSSGIYVQLKDDKKKVLRLFKVEASTSKTNFVVTNSPHQQSTEHATNISAQRWKIEQAHRELKQLTGIEKCQARSGNAQKNHIICSILAWLTIKSAATRRDVTVYHLKDALYSEYLKKEMANPTIPFEIEGLA